MSKLFINVGGISGPTKEARYFDKLNYNQVQEASYIFGNSQRVTLLHEYKLTDDEIDELLALKREVGIVGFEWEFQGFQYRFEVGYREEVESEALRSTIQAVLPTENFDHWVVITTDSSEYPYPNNALILDAQGRIVKQLLPPSTKPAKEISGIGLEPKPLQCITGVRWTDNRDLLEISFLLPGHPNNGWIGLEHRYLSLPDFLISDEVIRYS